MSVSLFYFQSFAFCVVIFRINLNQTTHIFKRLFIQSALFFTGPSRGFPFNEAKIFESRHSFWPASGRQIQI